MLQTAKVHNRLGRLIVCVAVAFGLYSLGLLGYSTWSWHKMKQEANTYLLADSARRAAAIADLAALAVSIARSHADLSEVRSFLLNRDLGMSMRYGLASSLEAINTRMLEHLKHHEEGLVQRIIYLDDRGIPLVDTHPATPLPHLPRVVPGKRFGMSINPVTDEMATLVPVDHKGSPGGSVVTVSAARALYRNLLHDHGSSLSEILVTTAGAQILPSRGEALDTNLLKALHNAPVGRVLAADDLPAGARQTGRFLLVKVPVAGLGLELATLFPEERAYGHIPSLAALALAALVPVLLMWAAFKLDRAEGRSRRAAIRRQAQAEVLAGIALSPDLAQGSVATLAAQLAEVTTKRFDIDCAGIWLFDQSRRQLVCVDEFDRARATHASGTLLNESDFGAELPALSFEKFVATANVSREPRLASYLEGHLKPRRVTALLDAVIRPGNMPAGVVRFERRGQPEPWTADETAFACALADQLALALSNAERERARADLDERDLRLARAAEEARELARTAERANVAKGEFLSNMSHEMRTPLNAILALSEALLEQHRGPLNERQQASLRNIESSGQHLLALINDILDISKIDAGRLDLQQDWCGIDDIGAASLAFVREAAEAKGVRLVYRSPGPGARVMADQRRLRQMLVNLLSNAVKFTPGGGQVSLEATLQAHNAGVRFCVVDTGIGISREDIGRLFRPFTQLDAGLARHHEGTGLGLALVRRLVDMHGGDISVESEPGRGSSFCLTLPRAMQAPPADTPALLPAPAPDPASPAPVPGPQATPAGLRLLLVEDNEANITAVGDYLQDVGFRLTIARNGRQALACLEEAPLPDLVLMDIQMPGMDGMETTRRLRRLPGCERLPVIALTALAMPGDRERCMDAGADEYITKPISLKHLVATIRRLAEPATSGEMKVL